MGEHVRIERERELPAIDIDLKLIAGFISITLASIYLPIISETPIRSILGLAMVLFVPGYALAAALFPGNRSIDGVERAGLSFGLSIALIPMIGLGLNYTPWGIRLDPVLVCLTIFSLACCAAANIRRHRLKQEDRFSPDLGNLYQNTVADLLEDHGRLDKAVTILLVLCILASVATLAFVIMAPKTGETYTQFYILGPDGKADSYPATFRLGEQKPVTVGIVNNERRDVTYDLVVVLNDSSVTSQLYTDQVTLADNQTLEKQLKLAPDRAGTNMKVEFLLYADGNMGTPYRELHTWINVT